MLQNLYEGNPQQSGQYFADNISCPSYFDWNFMKVYPWGLRI